VAAIAPETKELRELDAGTRKAWTTYSESLRGLRGAEYDRAEHRSWEELQSELRRLERRRESLNQTSA
jgi:hypothetical protein